MAAATLQQLSLDSSFGTLAFHSKFCADFNKYCTVIHLNTNWAIKKRLFTMAFLKWSKSY